jgi:hypothetical protein
MYLYVICISKLVRRVGEFIQIHADICTLKTVFKCYFCFVSTVSACIMTVSWPVLAACFLAPQTLPADPPLVEREGGRRLQRTRKAGGKGGPGNGRQLMLV